MQDVEAVGIREEEVGWTWVGREVLGELACGLAADQAEAGDRRDGSVLVLVASREMDLRWSRRVEEVCVVPVQDQVFVSRGNALGRALAAGILSVDDFVVGPKELGGAYRDNIAALDEVVVNLETQLNREREQLAGFDCGSRHGEGAHLGTDASGTNCDREPWKRAEIETIKRVPCAGSYLRVDLKGQLRHPCS